MAEKRRCGAKTRSGEPCKKWAVKGRTRCRLHGGANPGAPKGNKNALKTGEYETIWLDTLEAEELELFEKMAVDALKQLDDDIKLINIRIRRMMKRIQELKEKEFTVVKVEREEGFTDKGAVDVTKEIQEATLGQIMAIEESLTRLQEKKGKLIELKHKIQEGAGDGEEAAEWVKAIQAVADRRKLNGKKKVAE